MSLSLDREENTLIVSPQGRLDSNNAGAAEARIVEMIDAAAPQVVLDFSRLDYISSAGLRVVLGVAKRVKQANGRMALCSLQPHIREVFEISGFMTILTVCDDRSRAIIHVGG